MGKTTERLRHVAYVLDRLGIDDDAILSVQVDNQIVHPNGDVHVKETQFRRLFGWDFTRKVGAKSTDTLRHITEGVIIFTVVDKEPEGSGNVDACAVSDRGRGQCDSGRSADTDSPLRASAVSS